MFGDAGSLAEITRLRGLIAGLDPDGPPAAVPAAGDLRLARCRRVGVLPGSFNPPTDAHEALVESALMGGLVDAAVYLLSVRTVDKERITGLRLEDRLIALDLLIAGRPRRAAVLTNRGLYVDQVAALRTSFLAPDVEIVFLVGFDKILQIFDPKYYDDRDAALRRLFAGARIAVAPRAGQDDRDLAALIDRPENRPFADGVALLPLPPGTVDPDLSATRVREALAAGRPPGGVAEPVARFLRATSAFAPAEVIDGEPVDRYALRHQIVDRLMSTGSPPEAEATFDKWLRRSVQPTPTGKALRESLRSGR
ncbi:MAG TPA: hypothetical protein VHL09_04980 [Dehalococcoidia bacterium]|nr:hypothetical protein [Dehalococcoidia bacterium]